MDALLGLALAGVLSIVQDDDATAEAAAKRQSLLGFMIERMKRDNTPYDTLSRNLFDGNDAEAVQGRVGDRISAREKQQIYLFIRLWGDRLTEGADRRLAQLADTGGRNSAIRLFERWEAIDRERGKVSLAEARRLIEFVKDDGVQPAERRALVRVTHRWWHRIERDAQQEFEEFRVGGDPRRPADKLYNQNLPIRPGDPSNRLANSDQEDFVPLRNRRITHTVNGPGVALFSGNGRARGELAFNGDGKAEVHINFGQRKEMRVWLDGATQDELRPYVFVWNVDVSNSSPTLSGWIREDALQDRIDYMPTVPAPRAAGAVTQYKMSTGNAQVNEWLRTHGVKLDRGDNPDVGLAEHYLPRPPDNQMNLLYNLQGHGGVATDIFPPETPFTHLTVVSSEDVELYRVGSREGVGKMVFVYGRVPQPGDDRYGWFPKECTINDIDETQPGNQPLSGQFLVTP